MLSVARALVEFASWVRRVRSHVAGLESAIAHCVVALYHELTRRQPRSPTCSSKRQRTETFPGCEAFAKAKASGRVDVPTQGKQGSDC